MVQIKKIGVLSLGKIFALVYAIMGLIFGMIFTLISLVGSAVSGFGGFGEFFGIGSIIMLPIFYGGLGFIAGIISAFIYNIVASWVGGVEIETE